WATDCLRQCDVSRCRASYNRPFSGATAAMGQQHQHDVLIIGSGAAGLTAALHLAPRARVAVICKGELNEGSTRWAQGGIAAVLDATDSTESHVTDTLAAGADLCHADAVRF